MTGIDHRDAACVQFARDERRERTQPRRPLAITPPSSSSSRIRSQNKRRKITWRLSCSREAGWQTHTSPVGRGRTAHSFNTQEKQKSRRKEKRNEGISRFVTHKALRCRRKHGGYGENMRALLSIYCHVWKGPNPQATQEVIPLVCPIASPWANSTKMYDERAIRCRK